MDSSHTTIPFIRLSELTSRISATINDAFRLQTFWIIADITNHTFKSGKNYHYFDLVEKNNTSHDIIARISAVAWGTGATAISQFENATGQRFTNNINVLVNVSVQHHSVYGLQLTLHKVDTSFTLGLLEQERQVTLQRLVKENPGFVQKIGDTWHTQNKTLRLNRVIQRIAVVCSSTSAGWQDFKHTLDHNQYGYRFTVDPYFTLVQGEANAQQLVDRLIDIFQSYIPYDAVVIIRGGGSQTDFLLFDNYLVGRAIARFPIPVITGIGHQKNETVADLMANQATKTPTKAAELILQQNHAFENSLLALQKQVIIRAQQQLSIAMQRLGKVRSTVSQTKSTLSEKKRRLSTLSSNIAAQSRLLLADRNKDLQQKRSSLKTLVPMFLRNQRGYLTHHISMINALSPQSILRRGFAVVKTDGVITGDASGIEPGSNIQIILSDKEINATVKSKNEYDGHDFKI